MEVANGDELERMIAEGLAQFDDDVRERWEAIRIEPAKWRCDAYGGDGADFWVVAVAGDQALWYNDIEGGFNWSAFRAAGALDEYWCNQDELADILLGFAGEEAERTWQSGRLSTELPVELLGPGRVVARQAFYWELVAESGTTYRVHFLEPLEAVCGGTEYSRVELVTEHPVLDHYSRDWAMLDIHAAPEDPARVAARLEAAVREKAQGWRGLSAYSNGSAEWLLAGGFGLLMEAPRAYVDVAEGVLREEDVKCSVLARERPRRDYQALMLDRNYVVASEFGFEARQQGSGQELHR
ncbi:MAG: hypothetical protein R3B70_16985 [Polyangiaceae bacterium]